MSLLNLERDIEAEDTPRSVVRLVNISNWLSYDWTVKDE